ncbi:two-component system response regulator [Thalassotalea piscium]
MPQRDYISADAPTLLLVDDEASSLLIMETIFEGLGHIYTASSGKDALAMAKRYKPMVAVLDIEMADINGLELCQLLKSDPETADIAIIFVTSHTHADVEYKALEQGGIDFISKPLDGKICRQRVKNHIQLKIMTEAVKTAQRAAFKEKEKFRVTLNSIGDAVIATDTEGRITFMNPIAEHMTGWLMKSAMSKEIEEVMTLRDAETKAVIMNPIRLALQENRIVCLALNCQLISRDDVVYRVEDSASPIKYNGKVIGAVIVFHDISEAIAMAVKMNHMANHDQLTDLPNRVLLHDRITQSLKMAQSNDSVIALLLIDIDRFMFLNDLVGHYSGDRIIKLLAQRLQQFETAPSTLARIGGDEFVLLIPGINQYTEVDHIANEIVEAFRQPFILNDKKYKLTVSVGISLFPFDADSEESMMRHADVAMYRAKEQGRDQHCFFSSELEINLQQRHNIETLLRHAIEQDELEVHFQPQFNLNNSKIIAAEALVRLKYNDTYIPPLEFIPIAEDIGLINKLGEQVLFKSCQLAYQWKQAGHPIKIAVNISAQQFSNPQFYSQVMRILEKTKLPSTLLELEVTETALMHDFDETKLLLDKFRLANISISLDDFGTGYSSLSYLKFFDVHILKIDQSFIFDMLEDEQSLSIVKAIISLATALGLTIIAEGIETEAHSKMLQDLGCHLGQGYYFSRPLSSEQFQKLLFTTEKATYVY